jgi:phospholipid-binding lipoprotein MlaA
MSCKPASFRRSERKRAAPFLGTVAAVSLALLLAACASSGPSLPGPDLVGSRELPSNAKATHSLNPPTDAASLPEEPAEAYDPFEKTNRALFERNQRFNRAVVYPVAKAYQNTVPQPVRTGIENFVSNLAEPMVFANDVLQLRFGAAVTTVGRFAMNSTLGFAGVADVASKQNLPRQSGDFGQTLYIWGFRQSAYLIVPIIGPTNVRDLFGTTVETVATIPAGHLLPTRVASAANNLSVAGTIASPFTKLDDVGDMKELEESSLDFYAMVRSVVEQKREAELQEALQTSGWTAARYRSGGVAQDNSAVDMSFGKMPMPMTPTQEFMANTFQGANE